MTVAPSTPYSDAYLDTLEKVSFWMPLTKAFVGRTSGRRIVQGVASTPELDAQGDSVLQKGIDFSPLLERGYINWNHHDDPGSVIGVPLEASIRKARDGESEFHVRGALYEGVPKADDAWNLMQVMEKSKESGLPHRQLGWSVEGGIAARAGNYIVKSIVRMLALTHEPVNYSTFASLAKSLSAARTQEFTDETIEKSATLGSDGPLLLQNLAGGGKKSAKEVCLALFGKDVDACQDELGRFRKGRFGMFEHLVKCQGWDMNEAKDMVIRLHKSVAN